MGRGAIGHRAAGAHDFLTVGGGARGRRGGCAWLCGHYYAELKASYQSRETGCSAFWNGRFSVTRRAARTS
jgi:hypothetical protein